jgi:signal transduction histidine kinase
MPTGGHALVSVGLSAILLRELVRSADEAEALGARLQGLARARADALRAVELELARGEQRAAVGTLAAGVAHEINNPLAYVSANLNQLEALWTGDAEPEELAELIAECREGLGRVAAIANDLLRMAREGVSEQERVDLADVVRSVLPSLEREAGDAARIEASFADAPAVRGSPRLLGQVAVNLALNALHARAPRVALATRAARGGAELVVRDDGPGIPPELLERVFEPAFTSKPAGHGTGLGLSLVRLIVTRHGGAVRAESGAGGTTVTVWLPAAGDPAPGAP